LHRDINSFTEFSVKGVSQTRQQMFNLIHDKWVSDTVIEAYLKLIADSKTVVLPAPTMEAVFEGARKKLRYKLNNYDKVIGAVRINTNHWCLMFVNIVKSTVVFVNPSLASIDDESKALENWRYVFFLFS
jgi:hypothetical protein